jgi:hypothetical protein
MQTDFKRTGEDEPLLTDTNGASRASNCLQT